MTSRDDQLLQQIGRTNWIVLMVLLLCSLFWQSKAVTFGVAAGGLLVILNFSWMGRSLLKVIGSPHEVTVRGFKRNYFIRLLVVGSALYLLLVRGGVAPLALVTGLSVVVISLLIVTLKRLY